MINADASVFAHDTARRRSLFEIAAKAIEAVDPHRAVGNAVGRRETSLVLGDSALELDGFRRALVLAVGKGAVPMGEATVALLHGLPVHGAIVTNDPMPVEGIEVFGAGHPVPDERSVAAGRRFLHLARAATSQDLVVFLISGGGSALMAVPAEGLTLVDLQKTTEALLRSGASIDELNCVRKHLSAVAGGRLLEAASGAGAIVTLVMSDVVGNPLDVIASGPTVPDPTTYGDALSVVGRYGRAVPDVVWDHLHRGSRGELDETPAGGAVFRRQALRLVADPETAGGAAVDAARRTGWEARMVTSSLTGEARTVARRIVEDAVELEPGEVLVYTGETTVTVTGAGKGGRNQELALAAAVELDGRDDLVVCSIGTDGVDGVTDAAGAFGDGSSVRRGRAAGLEAEEFLTRNDSYRFLDAIGDLIRTGPTGTNVGDLVVACRSG